MRKAYIVLSIGITLAFTLLAVFVFNISYLRLWESIKDLGLSIAYYFCTLFGIDNSITPTVTEYSSVIVWDTVMPEDFTGFKNATSEYFTLLFSADNFNGWLASLGSFLGNLAKILTIALPIVLLLFLVIKRLYASSNVKHNKDTVPLKVFKAVSKVTYQPIKRFVCGYIEFVKSNEIIWKLWVLIWVLNLNLATILIAFFAYYFYFTISFDLSTLYVQFAKLFIDLQVIFRYFPWWLLGSIVWFFFNRWRKKLAKRKLRHFEARNCGFINELPIVSITCGSMGKKKTTMISDMVLSQEVMFRQKALEILQRADMKFPFFPWICFENELRACMQYHTVYNLATIKKWIALKRQRYKKHGNADLQLYGYDCERYGTTFNDALKINGLWDILETYALAYFVYVIESSLIVSNYSIRTDNELIDYGNFPMWAMDFFPERITEGRHAHILDFDLLRLGKKMVAENPNLGSFEFGVIAITEIGKERGNNLELKEVKKNADETNQKNDLFNAWLKMCRHSATINNFPFIKVFTDEQRPESWGSDARDLCEILRIISSGEQRLALPFYTIEDMISEWVFDKFINLYYDFRFRRGDNTLLVYLLKGVTAWIWKRNIRIYNRYGYSITKLEKERGTMDGKTKNKKYYLMNKKIYARRFITDCFSDFFNDLASKSGVGLNDYREYLTEKASIDELKSQNSYFINDLYGI